MRILLITKQQQTEDFFRRFAEKNDYLLITYDDIKELFSQPFSDSDFIVLDLPVKTLEIIEFIKTNTLNQADFSRILIILEDDFLVEEFNNSEIYNLLFKPLDEKTIKVNLSHAKKDAKISNRLAELNTAIKIKKKELAKLEKTLHLMPDGVIIVDTEAKITYSNSQVEQLFGYKPEELWGKDIEFLVPSKDREKHINYRDNYIASPKVRPMGSQLEVFGLKKDGGIFPVDISLSPVQVEGEFFIISTVKDISDRKQTQLELQKTKEYAESANRSKSEFLANMSHELRTPLNAILGYSQILLRDRGIDQKQKDEIKVIKTSGDHLLGLISDILDLSKIESGTMEANPTEFNLPDFISSIADIFKIRANEKSLSFHYEVLSELPKYVYTDEKKLRQILFNLLSNAIKFTETGGVALKVGKKDPTSSDSKILFQVEDTGIGINNQKLNQVFEPFTQVSSRNFKSEGTGLGLSISQKLADILGSKIDLKSTFGEGSSFFFELALPEINELSMIPDSDEKAIIGYSGERKKVLVVDDKPANRTLLSNLLSPLDFIVFEAIDGQDGMNKCLKYKPDLVFMDIRMPLMDGIETTKQIRKNSEIKDITIIALSASAFEVDRTASIEAGCNEFIAKPFRQDKIFQTLEKYLELEWATEDLTVGESISEDTDKVAGKTLNVSMKKLSPEEAQKIKELALMGDVSEILEVINLLEKSEKGNSPLINKIKQLAENFELEKILNLINEK